MGKTAVGVYDNQAHAEEAIRELTAAGYSREEIELRQSQANHINEMPGQAIDGDQISFSGILSLFGFTEDKEHHDIYAESLRRGCCVLSVNIDNDNQLPPALEIMQKHHPIDIDEQALRWTRQEGLASDAEVVMQSNAGLEQERASTTQAYAGDNTQPADGRSSRVKVFPRAP